MRFMQVLRQSIGNGMRFLFGGITQWIVRLIRIVPGLLFGLFLARLLTLVDIGKADS